MAGIAPPDAEPLTFTPARVYRVGWFEIEHETRNTIMGLSAETAAEWVRGCVSEKELRRVAAAIESRLATLDAKAKAKASKQAKPSK